MRKVLQKIDSGLALVESSLIVLILGTMVILAFLQVVLRNLFDTGILWGDVFLRHLVLWVGFIGASLATRQEKHINIDLFNRMVPGKYVPHVKMGIDLVSAAICVLLAKAGYVFVSSEVEFGTTIFNNIPSWIFEIIIPVGFALIAFRFLLKIPERIFQIKNAKSEV